MIGKTIKKYRIYDTVAEGVGGMSIVYLARQLDTNAIVAVKIPNQDVGKDSAYIERFRHEVEVHSKIDHPNIVRYLDSGQIEGGIPYLVMEYITGNDLSKLISQQKVSITDAIRIIHQIASALEAIHEKGIVHRDIDPRNIMVTVDQQAKLMDFGIARFHFQKHLTPHGMVIGKPHYISYEVAMGEPATPKSDIYSLGIVFFEALTGQVPFDSDTPLAILNMHIQREPGVPSRLNGRVPHQLDRVVAKMLAKDSRKRYQNARELIGDLEVFLQAPADLKIKSQEPLKKGDTVLVSSEVGDRGLFTGATRILYGDALGPRRRVLVSLAAVSGVLVISLVAWNFLGPPPSVPTSEVRKTTSTAESVVQPVQSSQPKAPEPPTTEIHMAPPTPDGTLGPQGQAQFAPSEPSPELQAASVAKKASQAPPRTKGSDIAKGSSRQEQVGAPVGPREPPKSATVPSPRQPVETQAIGEPRQISPSGSPPPASTVPSPAPQVALAPASTPAEIEREILSNLKRYRLNEITVKVDPNLHVTLGGKALDASEIDLAVRITQNTKGVRSLSNQIVNIKKAFQKQFKEGQFE